MCTQSTLIRSDQQHASHGGLFFVLFYNPFVNKPFIRTYKRNSIFMATMSTARCRKKNGNNSNITFLYFRVLACRPLSLSSLRLYFVFVCCYFRALPQTVNTENKPDSDVRCEISKKAKLSELYYICLALINYQVTVTENQE